MWRTLLGVCRIHGRVKLGEGVVEHLIELKAQKAGDYILLLNVYASSSGDKEKVKAVRILMKEKGIKTTPASSTIELKGDIHSLHPRKNEVYGMLDEIEKQLKIAGYVAEITSELHHNQQDADANPFRLSYHSEKLVIAFELLTTPPGTMIRVSKNLRIFVDFNKRWFQGFIIESWSSKIETALIISGKDIALVMTIGRPN